MYFENFCKKYCRKTIDTVTTIMKKVPNESKLIYAILSITNDIASSKIYDKRVYFNFETIDFPFLEGDDPRSLPMMYL